MPDPMSRDPEVVALENALPFALAEADDAGSEADDWTGSEYVMRMAGGLAMALHAAGYRVVAAENETEMRGARQWCLHGVSESEECPECGFGFIAAPTEEERQHE